MNLLQLAMLLCGQTLINSVRPMHLISNSSIREAAFLAKSQEITLQDSWR